MARVILSWVSLSAVRGGILAKIAPPIYALTEPLLRPIRRALAPYQRNMPLDFSPLVLFMLIGLVQSILWSRGL
jgi:YggT family protein